MQSSCPCGVCGKRDHMSTRCPELTEPLRGGFYTGPGTSAGGGDDEDEQLMRLVIIAALIKKQTHRLKKRLRC